MEVVRLRVGLEKRDFWKGHTALHCDTWVTSAVYPYMHTPASDTIAFKLMHKI